MRWKSAVLAALILTLLSGCGPVLAPQESVPAPSSPAAAETEPPSPFGLWVGSLAAPDELTLRLAPEPASPPAPAPAALTLTIDGAGRCLLRCDYSPCAASLQGTLADFLRALWAEEGESYPGAEPEAIADALLDERLPTPLLLTGTLSPDGEEIRWDLGEASPLTVGESGLSLSAPGLGELLLQRGDG